LSAQDNSGNFRREDYFGDTCYWFWYATNNECIALAYEQAIYDSVVSRTEILPKHNDKRPEGYIDAPFDALVNSFAKLDWTCFLNGILIKRFLSNGDHAK
jgi:hypothetical protein